MNRQEALEVLMNLEYDDYDKRNDEAMSMAIAALKPPTPDPDTGLVPCDYCKKPKKLMDDGYYKATPNTKLLPHIGDLVCTPRGEYAISAIDACEDDTFLCQGMTACPMCGRKLEVEG